MHNDHELLLTTVFSHQARNGDYQDDDDKSDTEEDNDNDEGSDDNDNYDNNEIDLLYNNNRILAIRGFSDHMAAPGLEKQPIQVSDPYIPLIIYDRDHGCYQLRYC